MTPNGAADSTQPWFEQDPYRKERELAEIRELAPAKEAVYEGRLRIITSVQYRHKPLPIAVDFPTGFPFVAPTIYARRLVLERHQNPLAYNFCIVDDEDHWWRPTFSSADLVRLLIELLADDEAGLIEQAESDVAEPLTGHLSFRSGRVVLVGEPMLSARLRATSGSMTLRQLNDHQWLLTKLVDENDNVVARLPDDLGQRFGVTGRSQELSGSWQDVPGDIPVDQLESVLARGETLLATEAARSSRRRSKRERKQGKFPQRESWSAVTFLEEGPTKEERRRAWMFYSSVGFPDQDEREAIVSQEIGEHSRVDRLRELRGLEAKSILVVGAGALGGPIVTELAKAGVGRIDVVDREIYDAGNAVRHVLPVSSAGLPKAAELAKHAQSLNPLCDIRVHELRLGGLRGRPILEHVIAAADVAIDATGSHTVTRLLHSYCSEAGVPLVSAALSVGGYGGRVVVLHAASPCFDCYRDNDGIPRPAQGEISSATPYSCSHPAASCAGFDSGEMAMIAVRTAVQLVDEVDYPGLDYDWAVINFRQEPRWTSGRLEPLPGCASCGGVVV